jgi:membrane protein YdbS with pleckstrin-like domain
MDAEQRFIVMLTLMAIILIALLGLVLFFVLWPYRMIIGAVFLGLIVLVVLLPIGITINEGVLRHKRVKYQRELPLDYRGQPLYLHDNMKPYRDPRSE